MSEPAAELPIEPIPAPAGENVAPFTGVLDCLVRPRVYFGLMAQDLGWAAPLARVEAWGLLAGLTSLALAEQGRVLGHALEDPARLGLYFGKVLAYQPIATLVTAAFFHLCAKVLGGKARFQASFRVGAALTVLAPFTELARLLDFYGLAAACAVMLYYWTLACIEVHSVPPKRAYALFGALAAGLAVLAVWHFLIP